MLLHEENERDLKSIHNLLYADSHNTSFLQNKLTIYKGISFYTNLTYVFWQKQPHIYQLPGKQSVA
jgi:hypothetical protein